MSTSLSGFRDVETAHKMGNMAKHAAASKTTYVQKRAIFCLPDLPPTLICVFIRSPLSYSLLCIILM